MDVLGTKLHHYDFRTYKANTPRIDIYHECCSPIRSRRKNGGKSRYSRALNNLYGCQKNICTPDKKRPKTKGSNAQKSVKNQDRFFTNSKFNEIESDVQDQVEDLRGLRRDKVPVYFSFSGKSLELENIDVQHVEKVQASVSAIFGMPTGNFMLFLYGKQLTERNLLKLRPYSTLEIIVKGKGGMQAQTFIINENSSEQDVQEWMKSELQLTQEDIDKYPDFQYLDGRTLLQYKNSSCTEFKNDLKIPLGLARKVLSFIKENWKDVVERNRQTDMFKWTHKDVRKCIEDSVKSITPEICEICDIVDKEEINGIAFISYQHSKEFQEELMQTDKSGVIFKRILSKRDELLKNAQIGEVAKVDNFQPESTSPEGTDKTNNAVLAPDDDWLSYIKDVFNLNVLTQPSSGFNSRKKCSLKLIHSEWRKRNELEKRLLFFVLHDENEQSLENLGKSLWNKIRKQMPMWYDYFNPKDKLEFSKSPQKDDSLLFGKTQLALSSNKPKMRFLMEKKLSELANSTCVFLLISRGVLEEHIDCYFAELEHPASNKKSTPITIDFSFKQGKDYWLFDPENFAFGFKRKHIPSEACGIYVPDLTEDCVKTAFPGDINKMSIPRNEAMPLNAHNENSRSSFQEQKPSTNLSRETQTQRRFKGDETEIQYREGWRISTAEHDGSVAFRCFEYKFIPEALIAKGSAPLLTFLNKEAIRFACGCLNARKNGTIMFGVGDSVGNSEHKKKNVHGEVVGIPINELNTENDDFVSVCTASLREAIPNCFEPHCHRIALQCISNPVFVKVVSKQPCSSSLYIIEIDVEPSSVLCKTNFFKINRSKLASSKDIEKDFTLYLREDTGTVKKTKAEEKMFVQITLPDIIQKRTDDEKQMLQLRPIEALESPMDRLRKFLCKGSNKLDKSIWPILILNKPTEKQKENEQWMRCLKFLKLVEFHAVFDFDDESNCNGICSAYCNMENSILQDEQLFMEYSGNKTDLADMLGIPRDMKTVWIYSNGRADIRPPKPSLSGSDWIRTYSAGIRDAVIFYSQKDIIPRGRALIIILLFSNNLEGLPDTFKEVVVRFGYEQVVVIATEQILGQFITLCADVSLKDMILERSVSSKNIAWEHVNATFFEITGMEDKSNIVLTTSSGAFVSADEKFIESLTEFHIVSAKQCENKTFKSPSEKEEFSSDMELQFYRGEKVDWFNFYFENHVLNRHCFVRLRVTIENILKQQGRTDFEKKIIANVIIAHEPGAGGTTLARSILWAFHKDYRCAIITKITERTSKNIISLWQHKETNNAKPLLLLIDELHQSDLTFEDLVRHIYKDYRSNPVDEGLICCFLVCQRENDLNEHVSTNPHGLNHGASIVEHLRQKLTDTEIQWMDEKFEKLEKKGAEYHPEYLLSFMILRKGFNQEYIRNTIKQFLKHIDKQSNEFELLEYTSLLSAYAPTTRRGPNVFIPSECCDDLMGSKLTKTTIWEKSMSLTLKMFLIVEQKETASGTQIRMAHPALAEAVLSQILENQKQNLSSLTLRFLESSILLSPSHGRKMVVEFTREMLVRRLKEEYDDDRTTQFSPLIEDICKMESWMDARNVLIKAFERVKGSYVAQTLARLCSRNKDFQNGISWAQQAVEMTIGTNANGFCHQTLAIVLVDLFNHQTKHLKSGSINPGDATAHIKIILDAYDHFAEASKSRTGNDDHILYPVTGALSTITSLVKFITTKVNIPDDVDIKRLVIDESYLPSGMEEWSKFKHTLSCFAVQGEKIFTIIEQCLCFNTTFYAHDKIIATSKDNIREHRFYRKLQYEYPDLFNNFKSFFGANKEEEPTSNMPEVRNNWHRRRLIMLGGNSYMNICNILRQLRSNTRSFNSHNAVAQCLEIKHHLNQITDRTPKDLSNLIAVNIVLGLLGGEKRDATSTILEYCKQIIKMKKDSTDLAYFYVCLLLWPSNQINVEYDDALFYESLRFLHRYREIKSSHQRDTRFVLLKEERNVTQPTPQFFLTNRHGFGSLCHRFDIFSKKGTESQQFENVLWESFGDKYHLKRLKGFVKFYDGKKEKSCIRIENEKSPSSPPIDIRKIRTGKKEFLSEEEVYFYLGFSIAGPIAYNVKPTRYHDTPHSREQVVTPPYSMNDFLDESEEELQMKLRKIEDLRSKQRNGRLLKTRESEILKHEQDIRTALEIKQHDLLDND